MKWNNFPGGFGGNAADREIPTTVQETAYVEVELEKYNRPFALAAPDGCPRVNGERGRLLELHWICPLAQVDKEPCGHMSRNQ